MPSWSRQIPVGTMGHQTLIGHDVTPCWRNHRLRMGFLADTQRQGIKLDQYFTRCRQAPLRQFPPPIPSTDPTKGMRSPSVCLPSYDLYYFNDLRVIT